MEEEVKRKGSAKMSDLVGKPAGSWWTTDQVAELKAENERLRADNEKLRTVSEASYWWSRCRERDLDVDRLEAENERLRGLAARRLAAFDEQSVENERLRAALRFYSLPSTYETPALVYAYGKFRPIDEDGGKIARAALEEKK